MDGEGPMSGRCRSDESVDLVQDCEGSSSRCRPAMSNLLVVDFHGAYGLGGWGGGGVK